MSYQAPFSCKSILLGLDLPLGYTACVLFCNSILVVHDLVSMFSDNQLKLDAQICIQGKKKSLGKRITGFQVVMDKFISSSFTPVSNCFILI